MRARPMAVLAALVLLTACAGAPSDAPVPPAAPDRPAAPVRDAATAAAIEAVLGGNQRSAANRARDEYRHPLETLLFFGIKPEMTVVEVWPGVGGWYTEVLAPLLRDRGRFYTATMPPVPGNEYVTLSLERFHEKLASRPDLYGKVEVTRMGPGNFEIAPPGSADMVLAFDNLHDWMNLGFAPDAIAAMHRALEPGGILGLVEHRGDPAKPQDPRAANGYVSEKAAIELIEAAGFELVDRSEINANSEDTKDYEQGVWALPPDYRAGNRDRARYEAIGESDRMTLKFRRR